jgi:transposase
MLRSIGTPPKWLSAATAQPKAADGDVEMIRALQVARRSATKARTQAANQLRALLVTAPADLRQQLRTTSLADLIRVTSTWRPGTRPNSPTSITKLAMRSIARRYQQLDDELTELDQHLARLVG